MAAASASNGPSPTDVDQFQRRVRGTAVVLIRYQEQFTMAELLLTLATTVPSRYHLHAAMRLLNDVDTRDTSGIFFLGDPLRFNDFRRWIYLRVLVLLLEQEARYDERVTLEAFPQIVLRAAQQAAGLLPRHRETAQTQEISTDAVFAYLERALGAIRQHQAGGLVLPDDNDDETTQPYPNGGFGEVPASAAALRSLEKQTFHGAAGGNGDAITECGICFEEFLDGAQVSVMPCPSRVHKFHHECIAKWLGISNMCPLCRHRLPTADVYEYDQ